MHTHSPCQNLDAFSASSAFWASVLRLPKTPREVGAATARVETTARGVDGANASVDEAKRQIAAMMAMMLFMVKSKCLVVDSSSRYRLD